MGVEFFKMRKIKIKIPKFLKSVRYSLAAVNSLFLVTGFVLIITGAVILLRHREYSLFITQRFVTLPEFATGTGVVIVLTSIIGFYAAISEQFYFIIGYLLLLASVLIFEISITITGYGLRDNPAREIRATMVQSLQLYGRTEVAMVWDNMQMEFQCCGVAGRHDFASQLIPVSCCFINVGAVSPFVCTSDVAHRGGCASALGDWLGHNVSVIAVVALTVTIVQVILTSLAAWLAWRSKFEEVELEK